MTASAGEPAGTTGGLARADSMARRLIATARRHGLATGDAASIGIAFDRIVRLRWRAFEDEHHVDHLHPARTALILLDDVGLADAAPLRTALLYDSLRAELVPDPEAAAEIVGAESAELLRMLPRPDASEAELIEALVTADGATLAIALAERLDHARHLHLRHDIDGDAVRTGVERVYLPLARRLGGRIERRYQRFVDVPKRRRR